MIAAVSRVRVSIPVSQSIQIYAHGNSNETRSLHPVPDSFTLFGESIETVFLLFFRNEEFDQLLFTKFTECS